MKLRLFPLLAVLCAVGGLFAQQPRNLKVLQTDNHVIQAMTERVSPTTGALYFHQGLAIEPGEFLQTHKGDLGLCMDDDMILHRVQQGRPGEVVYRYRQLHRGLPVEGAEFVVHTRHGELIRLKGRIAENLDLHEDFMIDQNLALETAIQSVDSLLFKWERPEVRAKAGAPATTMLPRGERVVIRDPASDKHEPTYRTAYKFRIDSVEPLESWHIFVDGETGAILHKQSLLKKASNAEGTFRSTLYGPRAMMTTKLNTSFILQDMTRNIHVRAFNTFIPFGFLDEITDDNNSWADTVGPASLWSVQRAYEYFRDRHNLTGVDGANEPVNIHAGGGIAAFQDDGAITTLYFSDGYPVLDVAGHEYTHAIVANTAGLLYEGESGALDESFADIFGSMTEAHVLGGLNNDWLLGTGIPGGPIRSMINPNDFSDPDTFQGLFWVNPNCGTPTFANDFCGVHTNSGVQNHWFYLLSQGGTQNGVTVAGIGNIRARDITYRNMTLELFPTADHFDAREGALDAARDLYGCGQETFNVANAWAAVGVGAPGGPGQCVNPPPPPLNALVLGPTTAFTGGQTTWTSSVSGGQAPYSYQWRVNGVLSGSNASFTINNPSAAFALQLTVTDGAGQTSIKNMIIDICNTPQECLGPIDP